MVRGRRDPGRATPVRRAACSARARKGAHRFAQSLAEFLASVLEPVIIADWPDDIRSFCHGLGQFGSVMRVRPCCTFVLLPQQRLCALQTTHNALLDARALRLWHAERANATACDELSADISQREVHRGSE